MDLYVSSLNFKNGKSNIYKENYYLNFENNQSHFKDESVDYPFIILRNTFSNKNKVNFV